RNSFRVVIEHVRLGLKDNPQRVVKALEIRDQDLDAAARRQFSNLADGFGKNAGPAQIVVIAIHASYNRVFQSECGDGLGNTARLTPINSSRLTLGHRANTAATSADVTQQHERGGAVIPALADVGTLCRFTDGVQSQASGQLLEIMEVLAGRGFGSEPFR